MTKFNLNPNYRNKKIKLPFTNIFKPVYLSIALIVALIIISIIYTNIADNEKMLMIKKHYKIYSNILYKNMINDLNTKKINVEISNIRNDISSYRFQQVKQNIKEILLKLSLSYSKYLPTGFVLHYFNYEIDSQGASKTTIEIYYLKNYIDEAKAFLYSTTNYINNIKLKEFAK